jgi:hypothetical protein
VSVSSKPMELVPALLGNVESLFGGKIPSLVCNPRFRPGKLLLSSAVGSIAEASMGGVGVATFSVLDLVGACGTLFPVAVLCIGKKPVVPLVGCNGTPVPVARNMVRVMVRVADDIVVVTVSEIDSFFPRLEDVEASSCMQPTSKYLTSLRRSSSKFSSRDRSKSMQAASLKPKLSQRSLSAHWAEQPEYDAKSLLALQK